MRQHKLDTQSVDLFDFIKQAIEGREIAKFVFTQNLSEVLKLFGEFGAERGFSKEECSYADISIIETLHASSEDAALLLERSISEGQNRYRLTRQIALPPLIVAPSDAWFFEWPLFTPNYITLGSASGETVFLDSDKKRYEKGILFLPSADPGYDWIFSHGIAAFVTMYGGANSHMAIRAGELGVPAVIGAGETFYKRWSAGKRLHIDCANRQVKILQ